MLVLWVSTNAKPRNFHLSLWCRMTMPSPVPQGCSSSYPKPLATTDLLFVPLRLPFPKMSQKCHSNVVPFIAGCIWDSSALFVHRPCTLAVAISLPLHGCTPVSSFVLQVRDIVGVPRLWQLWTEPLYTAVYRCWRECRILFRLGWYPGVAGWFGWQWCA